MNDLFLEYVLVVARIPRRKNVSFVLNVLKNELSGGKIVLKNSNKKIGMLVNDGFWKILRKLR